MLAILVDHLGMLADQLKHLALGLALLAEAREFILEPALMLAAIFVIVAVQLLDLALAPAGVMLVMRRLEAGLSALLRSAEGRVTAIGLVIVGCRAMLVGALVLEALLTAILLLAESWPPMPEPWRPCSPALRP
jgi:hypothetical protein